MKKLFIGLLVVVGGIHCSYGQSRGIKYWLNTNYGIQIFGAPNVGRSTTFEIANENIMTLIPDVKQNGQWYSVLSRFDNTLCYLGSKKILENPSSSHRFGTFKNDGGFATHSWTSPFVIRNYDNQGNLLFCKKIVDTNTYNALYSFGGNTAMVANPDNNNLYFAYSRFSNETHDSIPLLHGSPLINLVEMSPTGNLVNAFQFKIPYTSRYLTGSGGRVIHTWNDIQNINDIKYVKGPYGPASDRIWLTVNITPSHSYIVDANNEITSQYAPPILTLSAYTAVLVIQPVGGSGDATLLTDITGNGEESILESKSSIPLGGVPAQMMIIKRESSIPYIYKFNDYTNASPNFKYKFPFTVFVSFTGLKYYQGKILFSAGTYFGTFNENNLEVNVRTQSLTNAPVLGSINYVTRDTNKLYINYHNALGGSTNYPMNFLTKENITDYKVTCGSDPFLIQNAVTKPFNYFKLDAFTAPYSGISLVNEPYTEIVDNRLVIAQDVCLRCGLGRYSEGTSSNSENLDIIMHPNPANNYFELTTELTIEKVEVYSMLGQLVKSFDQQNQYSITDLVKGSYIIKITTPEGISSKTLVVE